MRKRVLALVCVSILLTALLATFVFGKFDEFGYNRKARIFVGTGGEWCQAKGLSTSCLGAYSNDRLVMKWNAEWDRGNAEGWTRAPYGAWEDNEWNGNFPGGTGESWHYKIRWDSGCAESGTPSVEGGYCIWGQFEVLMDQGKDPNVGPGHLWFAHASPTGYGSP